MPGARALGGLLATAAVATIIVRYAFSTSPVDIYALGNGEVIAIRSLSSGRYLSLDPASGRVYANAETPAQSTARWRVLALDMHTAGALARSAQSIDARSERFTGRRMRTVSGCVCSGYSNAHGYGRFCHPWEDPAQESWCYVSQNCTSASAHGSFGKPYEPCDAPVAGGLGDPPAGADAGGADPAREVKLMPASGCNCSGKSNSHGYGASCRSWEYDGQPPWCYVEPSCKGAEADMWSRVQRGSFGMPYEDCIERETRPAEAWPSASAGLDAPPAAAPSELGREFGRRLQQAPPRLAKMLASKPEAERYIALISLHSHGFMAVEPPPHREALRLTARSDELSVRAIFSSFEQTHLVLSLATNSLLNLVDAQSGEVCAGARARAAEGAEAGPLKLLRQARRTARWAFELV